MLIMPSQPRSFSTPNMCRAAIEIKIGFFFEVRYLYPHVGGEGMVEMEMEMEMGETGRSMIME